MEKKNWLTKILAVSGTILVAVPVVVPIVFAVDRLIQIGLVQIDYLMPVELGLVVLIGAGMVLWSAIRSHTLVKWVAWWISSGAILVIGGLVLAAVTGLASGATEATGWKFITVIGLVLGFDLSVVMLSVGGIVLCNRLFRRAKKRHSV